MRRTTGAVVAAVLVLAGGRLAYGLGKNLDRPSIAMPVDPKTQAPDPVARAMNEALQARQKDFTGGSFLNSHTVLSFGGGTAGVNALLAGLAAVEGATVRVKLSKEVGVTRWMFPGKGTPPDPQCDCQVDHLAWGDAHAVTVTIYLGGGRVDPDALEFPPFTNRPAAGTR